MVNVILTTGLFRYCTTFDAFGTKDGSDGKKFLGKDAPPPGSCPVPPTSP